jgi:uncharacterized membrane protein
MNLTHLHLLINHVAAVGAFLGIVVLLFAIRSKSSSTYYAAYTVLIIAAVGAVIAYSTGESAEESVEGMAGVTESTIELHEDSAPYALGSFILLGVLSLAGVYLTYKSESLQPKWNIIILIVGLISFIAVSRTAWLGGKIRHTEISAGMDVSQGASEAEGDEEEDD